MDQSSLRELGTDFLEDRQFERALGVFAEGVRRAPSDHQSRMLAAHCLSEMGEKERAVMAFHACAEGLLHRDYLLSAMAAVKAALELNPTERLLKDTLARIHARAARSATGKAKVPPPLPPESLTEGVVAEDLMTLQGEALSNRAFEVLAAPDNGAAADPNARPSLPLFAELERDAFVELVTKMSFRRLKEDEVVSQEGQSGETIYVIIAGKGHVTRMVDGQKRTLGALGGGSIFGELSMLTGSPPTATVVAAEPSEIFELRRETLNELAKHFPSVPPVLAEFAQQRMAKNLMTSSPLFQQIPEKNRATLLQRFKFRALGANERALVEGEHSPGLFLVLAGELVVQKEDPAGGQVTLGILREGDVAGEISLLKGLRATATVVSTRKTATAYLDRAAFSELLKEYPDTQTYLEKLSDRRLKQIGEALRPAEIIDADELVMEADKPAPGGVVTRGRLLAVIAAGAAATITYVLLTKPPPSADELIRRKAIAMAEAAQKKDVAAVMAELAPEFRTDEGLGRNEVKQVMVAQLFRGEWVRVFTANLEVSLTSPTTADFKGSYIFGRSEAKELKELARDSVISAYEISARLQLDSGGEWRFVWAKWQPIDSTALF